MSQDQLSHPPPMAIHPTVTTVCRPHTLILDRQSTCVSKAEFMVSSAQAQRMNSHVGTAVLGETVDGRRRFISHEGFR